MDNKEIVEQIIIRNNLKDCYYDFSEKVYLIPVETLSEAEDIRREIIEWGFQGEVSDFKYENKIMFVRC